MHTKLSIYSAVLGLTGRIDSTVIRSAYHKEMLKWHPDLHQGKDTFEHAHIKAQAINEAYEFLSEIAEDGDIVDIPSSNRPSYDRYSTRHTYRRQSFRLGFPDSSVFEVFVKSSNIVSTGYNAPARILYLKFHNASIYRYFDVSRTIFEELLAAESHGSYANKKICRSFRYEQC